MFAPPSSVRKISRMAPAMKNIANKLRITPVEDMVSNQEHWGYGG